MLVAAQTRGVAGTAAASSPGRSPVGQVGIRSVSGAIVRLLITLRNQRLTQTNAINPFLEVLSGRRQAVPPIWMMRQAGPYLPGYREIRGKAGGLFDICFMPA